MSRETRKRPLDRDENNIESKQLKSSKEGQNEDNLICREFPRYRVITLCQDLFGKAVTFSIPKNIPLDTCKQWRFEVADGDDDCDYEIKNDSGFFVSKTPSKNTNHWISDKTILSSEFTIEISWCIVDWDTAEWGTDVVLMGKTDKLPPPKIINHVTKYEFTRTDGTEIILKSGIQSLPKGKEKWNKSALKLNFTNDDETWEIRRNEYGVYSDIVELMAPWEATNLQLPLKMSSLIVRQVCETLGGYPEAVEITQGANVWTYNIDYTCQQCPLQPGIPFEVKATYKDFDAFFSDREVPLPPEYFNTENWLLFAGDHGVAQIQTVRFPHLPIWMKIPSVILELSSKGYFALHAPPRHVIGYFDILQASGNTFVFEFRTFHEPFKPQEDTIDTQQSVAFPLRNKDLHSHIMKFWTPADKRTAKLVCKLWNKFVGSINTVKIVRGERHPQKEPPKWISNDLAGVVDQMFDQNGYQ